MRMEELSENRYFKTTDTVERYLLNVIDEYFKSSGAATSTSREYIIQMAVDRMKEELALEGVGVTSVVLPSGETRTGAVNISLEDLDGEPVIFPKNTAFNVPFGTEKNTACEGDDPRLSDKRMPTEHSHNIDDVAGLSGELSTILGKIERTGGLAHSHDNKSVLDKLTYSGTKSSIDLAILDSLGDDVKSIVDSIKTDIALYDSNVLSKTTEINTKVSDILAKIEEFKTFIKNEGTTNLASSKNYTDDSINSMKSSIDGKISDFVKKEDVEPVINAVKSSYTFAGTTSYKMNEIIDSLSASSSLSADFVLPEDIINEISSRGTFIDECFISMQIQWFTDDGTKIYYPLPYVIFSSNEAKGSINASVCGNGIIKIECTCPMDYIPPKMRVGNIIIDVYSKNNSLSI